MTTQRLMLELSRYGKNDIAYKLATTHQFPSWGYSIDQGATTIWERWDGWVKGRGFQSIGMNSFNHYSIGAVGEWMYRVMLGINWDEEKPAMKHIILKPQPDASISYAKGSYESHYGRIAVEWKLHDGKLDLKLTVPTNTKATLHIPTGNPASVRESNQELNGSSYDGKNMVVKLGSGKYQFTADYAAK